jgi:hypothetical protein
MNKDAILQFINEVIITNGLENGLDAEKVKENISNYKRYLQENGFADEETLKIVTVIETKAKEYYELAKSFKAAGLDIPTVGAKKDDYSEEIREQTESETKQESGAKDESEPKQESEPTIYRSTCGLGIFRSC